MSLCPSQIRLHTGRPSAYVIPPNLPLVLAAAALGAVHDENREEAGVPVSRWTVAERQPAGVGPPALLVAAAGVRQAAAVAPPQRHRAVGPVHAAERESRRVRGEVPAGEDGGAA